MSKIDSNGIHLPVYVVDFKDGTSIWGRIIDMKLYFKGNPDAWDEVVKVTEYQAQMGEVRSGNKDEPIFQ